MGVRPTYPTWAYQPRIIAYLGFNPFTETGLKSPKGNETSGIAFLAPEAPTTMGQKIKLFRLKFRKTRRGFASQLGISVKTLWGWETDRWLPSKSLKKKIDPSIFAL